MVDEHVVLTSQKIKSGKSDRLRERFDMNDEQRDDLVEQLEDEGITLEAVFIEDRTDGEYMYYLIRANDFDEMLEEWRESDAAAAEQYADFLDDVMVNGADEYHENRLERIFYIDPDEYTE